MLLLLGLLGLLRHLTDEIKARLLLHWFLLRLASTQCKAREDVLLGCWLSGCCSDRTTTEKIHDILGGWLLWSWLCCRLTATHIKKIERLGRLLRWLSLGTTLHEVKGKSWLLAYNRLGSRSCRAHAKQIFDRRRRGRCLLSRRSCFLGSLLLFGRTTCLLGSLLLTSLWHHKLLTVFVT